MFPAFFPVPGDLQEFISWLSTFSWLRYPVWKQQSDEIMTQLFGLERKSLWAWGSPGCVCLLGVDEGEKMRLQ